MKLYYAYLCGIALATLSAQNLPTVLMPSPASAPAGIAPIGIGATTSELLFSQPFCASANQARGIYSVTNVTSPPSAAGVDVTLTTPLPENGCSEDYFAISPGLGGFGSGSTYATDANGAGGTNVYRNGDLFIANIPNGNPQFAGAVFDSIGTFDFALIVTTQNAVTGYNSSGAQLFSYPTPSGYTLENATVAPSTNGACPGCLYLAARSLDQVSPGAIFTVPPGAPSGTAPTLVAVAPGGLPEPEAILYISPQSCSLANTNYSYFLSGFASGGQRFGVQSTSGAILAYTTTQLTPDVGMFLVPFESGVVYQFNGTVFTGIFSDLRTTTPPYQLEGSSFVQCSPASGCPATQGFWKHHTFPSTLFSGGTVNIGGVPYTATQLVSILNTPPAKGDATLILMHQLIAALANEAAGARNVGVVEDGVNVNTAIAEAESLLRFGLPQPGFPGANPGNVVFPINLNGSSGSYMVQASSTLGGYFTTLANVLDAYNSGNGLNCQEGAGLSN